MLIQILALWTQYASIFFLLLFLSRYVQIGAFNCILAIGSCNCGYWWCLSSHVVRNLGGILCPTAVIPTLLDFDLTLWTSCGQGGVYLAHLQKLIMLSTVGEHKGNWGRGERCGALTVWMIWGHGVWHVLSHTGKLMSVIHHIRLLCWMLEWNMREEVGFSFLHENFLNLSW